MLLETFAKDFMRGGNIPGKRNQGASVLLLAEKGIYFTLKKRPTWKIDRGLFAIEVGGIGGGFFPGERAFECLRREICEEIGISTDEMIFLEIESSYLIDQNNHVTRLEKFSNDPFSQEPSPPIIFERQMQESLLQLFIYVAKLKRNDLILEIPNGELIPALVHVEYGKVLNFIAGYLKEASEPGIKTLWNTKLNTERPDNFYMRPKIMLSALKILLEKEASFGSYLCELLRNERTFC